MPISGEALSSVLNSLTEQQLVVESLPITTTAHDANVYVPVREDAESAWRSSVPMWNPDSLVYYFSSFDEEVASDEEIAVLVHDTVTRGRIVVEASPARVRRLITVPLVWAAVLASPTPLAVLAAAGALLILELVAGTAEAAIAGLQAGVEEGVQQATAAHVKELADDAWRRARGLPPPLRELPDHRRGNASKHHADDQ